MQEMASTGVIKVYPYGGWRPWGQTSWFYNYETQQGGSDGMSFRADLWGSGSWNRPSTTIHEGYHAWKATSGFGGGWETGYMSAAWYEDVCMNN